LHEEYLIGFPCQIETLSQISSNQTVHTQEVELDTSTNNKHLHTHQKKEHIASWIHLQTSTNAALCMGECRTL